ncbi:MAG: sulfatase [Gammaproteobacteria bacterium]|nr:sulfatase [Gammaproteobacteria bacterium]
MKRREAIKAFLSAALLSPLASRLSFGATRKGVARKPNIILILADDLGYGALGSYGNRFNETPNLDRLAREGLRFRDAYASATVCSPTRAALMIGQHPARSGITNYLEGDDVKFLSPSYITLNQRMKSAGYTTGLGGKWHLTGDYHKRRGAPQSHHWDEVILSETDHISLGDYFAPYFFMPGVKAREPNEYLTDRLNFEAVDFIRRHKDKPFFLYLSHYAPHTNLAAKPDIVARYKRKPGAGGKGKNPVLAAMIESIDDGVGGILRTLKILGLDDDTLVIFTSDNGGETNVTTNAPLRAGKSWLYEGGIRVPLVMRYPVGIRAGAASHVPVVTHDHYMTLMELANVRASNQQPTDGVSLAPLFAGRDQIKRDALYWHYPLAEPHFLGGRSAAAMRHDNYKLIEFLDTGEMELYNLAEDIGESKNLARAMPDKVMELHDMMEDWREWIGASMEPMRPLATDAGHG